MLSPRPPLERLQITIAPSSMSRRNVIVLFGCASMLRSRGSMRTLPILFWIGEMASIAEARAIRGILVEPESAHHGIADMVLDDVRAELVVDQKAGEHQQGRARHVEQSAHGIGQDVIEPRPPAVGPDVPERGDHAVGDDWLEIIRHLGQGIEADRPVGIGRVDVDEIVGACLGNVGEHRSARSPCGSRSARPSPATRSWRMRLRSRVLLPVPVWPMT